jgi:hypothetical protein
MYTVRYKNVLWIDPDVRDYQVFVDSVNSDTLAVLYPEEWPDADRIGFVFEKGGPMAAYLQENVDRLLASRIKHMDFLACDTLPDWKEYYAKLEGITVGASNNRTGNLQYGGDWIMESTCEDVESIYFTQSIDYYSYLLGNGFNVIVIDTSNNVWTTGNRSIGRTTSGNNYGTYLSKTNMSNVQKVSTGYDNSLVLSNGKVYSCGTKNTAIGTNIVPFTLVPNLNNVTDIAAGEGSAFVISNGLIHGFYDSSFYSLDITADKVRNFGNYRSVLTGNDIVLAQMIYLYNGIVYNSTKVQISPVGVTIIEISMGRSNHWLGISDTGGLYLGTTNGTNQNISARVTSPVELTSNVTAISAGAATSTDSFDMVLVGKQLYTRESNDNVTTAFTKYVDTAIGTDNVDYISAAESVNMIIINNKLYTCGRNQTALLSRPINSDNLTFKQALKSVGSTNTNMDTAYLLPDTSVYIAPVISLLVNSIEKTTAIVNSSVKIGGTNFLRSNLSYLYVGNTSTDFSILSSTSIEFKVPNVVQTNLSVNLYTSEGTLVVTTSFTIPPLFAISNYNPSSVFARAPLQIDGTNFSLINYVQFGSTQVQPFSVSTTQIQLTVPIGLPNNVSVTVVDLYNNASSISTNLSILNLSIGSVTPTSAVRNASIMLNGINLINASYVVFGNTSTLVTYRSNTAVNVSVPAATSSLNYITLYDIYGNNTSILFTVATLFSVSRYNPSSVVPNTHVKIIGSNFSNINYVQVGSSKIVPNSVDNTEIVLTIPPGLPNSVPVTVVDLFNNSSSISTNLSILNLSLGSVVPNSAVRNASITLHGYNLSNADYVVFGNTSTPVTYRSKNSVNVFVPVATSTLNYITLYDIYGNNISALFTVATLFSVSSYNPSSVIPRTSLQILGSNFSNISYVLFGDQKAFPYSATPTLVNISVPNGLPNNVSVTVVDVFNNASSISSNLSILNLSIGSITPNSAVRNASITILGENLMNTSFVVFGNISKQVTYRSNSMVNVSVPSTTSINYVTLYDIYGNNLSVAFIVDPLFSNHRS